MVLRVTSRDDILKTSIGAKGSERRIQMNQKLFYEANLMTNLIQADFGANNGTSGGPLITVASDGSIRLVGSASVNSTSSFYCIKIQYMVDAYGLTVMPEGSISV